MLDAIPVFAILKAKLGYDGERQKVIAQNVANADTPGYAPRDLSKFSVSGALGQAGGIAPTRTHALHLSGRAPAAGPWKAADAPDTEARLDGNQVVLEEQMMKMNEASSDYQAALTLYSQSLGLLRTAARAPGK